MSRPNEDAIVLRETLLLVSLGPIDHTCMAHTDKEILLHVWRSTS